MSHYPEDATAERDEQLYADFLATYGIPHVCLTCGEREVIDPRSRHYLAHSVFCGQCTHEMLPEDEITPELAGKLLCKRAGITTDHRMRNWFDHSWTGPHVLHYVRPQALEDAVINGVSENRLVPVGSESDAGGARGDGILR